MAYQLIRLPDMLISGPFWFYIFTALSRASHRGGPGAIQDLARAGLRLGSAAVAPLFLGLALIADLAVPIFLGPKWTGAIGPLRFLAAAGFGFCMCSMMAAMLMGLGRAALQFRLSVTNGLVAVLTVAGSVRFGVAAVSAAIACGVWGVALYYVDQLARDLGTTRVRLLGGFIPAGLGALALTAAVLLARTLLHAAPPGVALAGAVPAGAAAYAAAIWFTARRRLLADARAFGRIHAEGEARGPGAEAAKLEAETALNPVG
jgi:PST family polysaccharide transporter